MPTGSSRLRGNEPWQTPTRVPRLSLRLSAGDSESSRPCPCEDRGQKVVLPDMVVSRIEQRCDPERIRRFVNAVERLRQPDLGFRDDPRFPPLPVAAGAAGFSRYLLLAASIDVGANSNHIRLFLHALNARLAEEGRGLFQISSADAPLVLATIDDEQRAGRLPGWRAKRQVPRILAEANRFVDHQASGDLDRWSRGFTSPRPLVAQLATQIWYQGRPPATETRKKMWMLLRWLVRPAPDLRLWSHFSPADLMVPVDRHVARFALTAGIIPSMPEGGPYWRQVELITAYARQLFPDDPARVDYALFMWGRGLSRPGPDPDTCHTLFRDAGAACPLSASLRCCGRCPSAGAVVD